MRKGRPVTQKELVQTLAATSGSSRRLAVISQKDVDTVRVLLVDGNPVVLRGVELVDGGFSRASVGDQVVVWHERNRLYGQLLVKIETQDVAAAGAAGATSAAMAEAANKLKLYNGAVMIWANDAAYEAEGAYRLELFGLPGCYFDYRPPNQIW